jgi:phosphatidylinositol glycan class U
MWVANLVLFNPALVLGCVAMSTQCATNALLALAVLCAMRKYRGLSAFWLGMAVYLDMYPVMLVLPLAMLCSAERPSLLAHAYASSSAPSSSSPSSSCLSAAASPVRWMELYQFVQLVVIWTGWWLCVSSLALGGFQFVWDSYGAVLGVKDLTPNSGVHWYFFTEVFTRFRVFFLCAFQGHLLFYVLPLCVRLRHEPLFVVWVLVAIAAIHRTYPSLPGYAFAFSLLCTLFTPLVAPTMRRLYLLVFLAALSACMGSTFWYLWIFPQSGNANFVFFQTIIFCVTSSLLVVECVVAVRKGYACRLQNLPPTKEEYLATMATSRAKAE